MLNGIFMKIIKKTKAERRKRKYLNLGALILAIAILLNLLCACGAREEETQPVQTPTAQPATSVLPTPEPKPAVSAVPEPSSEPSVVFVDQVVCTADEYANIREKADTDTPVIAALPAGETVGVTEYTDEWAHISYQDITGYISRDYIVSASAPEAAVPMGGWAAILVNPANYLPQDFSVTLADFEGGQVDERIRQICEEMFRDAKEDGISLQLVDAYRSYDRQNELYQKKVESFIAKGLGRADAETQAATITARPDTSEHQTGLALDIVTPSYTSRDKGFADTRAFQWLNANAQNYGFILRYKRDKVEFTKVIYEPWHWRFVGVQAAGDMKKSGECMEEYLGILN